MPCDLQNPVAGGDLDGQRCDGGEYLGLEAFADEHVLQAVENLAWLVAGQHKRSPGHPQAYAERSFVGPVAAHVADECVQRTVAQLDKVIEVAAKQRLVPARPVAQRMVEAGIVKYRNRKQSPLEPGVLGLADLRLPELAGRLVRPLAFDRVPNAPAEGCAVDLALDQVVLRAGRHGGDAK